MRVNAEETVILVWVVFSMIGFQREDNLIFKLLHQNINS